MLPKLTRKFRASLIAVLGLAALLSLQTGYAQEERSIVLNDGELEIPVMQFGSAEAKGPLLLWLPSAYGTTEQQSITARALADRGFQTWIVDLHIGYFADVGRNSEQQFKAEDIAQLIDVASAETSNKIYVMATDAVTRLALEAIALYQQQAAKTNTPMRVGGAILFEPNLSYAASEPGTPARYYPVAQNSTIPIYYFQPMLSTRQWRTQDTVDMLQAGGSQVFLRSMAGVGDGFHLLPDDELTDADLAERDLLPVDLMRAVRILSIQAEPTAPIAIEKPSIEQNHRILFGLKQLKDRVALPITLNDADNQAYFIDYSNNKLTLVSFWASWCQPCIAELPALKRLYKKYANKGMQFVLINVGESADDIRYAINKYEMPGYQHLQDPEGETMKAWNVYGFPTNFLIKPNGDLPLASFGAVEWDEPEVHNELNQLLGL